MSSSEHLHSIQTLLAGSVGPLSADEVRRQIGERSISLATVYRVLKQGVEAQVFREIPFAQGPSRYETADREHHHHFLCESCDRAFDLPGCSMMTPAIPANFEVLEHEVLLRGICAECRSSK